MGASSDSAASVAAIKAAKKALKRQESGSMKIKSLAKKVHGSMVEEEAGDQAACRDTVRRWIEGSDKFTLEGKVVSLSSSSSGNKKRGQVDAPASRGDGGDDGRDGSKSPRKKAKKEKKKKEKSSRQQQPKNVREADEPKTKADSGEEKEEKKKEKEVVWNSFRDAPFAQPVQDALTGSAGFTEPSPIQARAWPVVCGGRDLIAVAKTGSGKTLGFLLPVFHRIHTKDLPGPPAAAAATRTDDSKNGVPSPTCLVLSPTRELAVQIHGEATKFGSSVGIASECVYGGTNLQAQIRQLRESSPEVVIATPGRLCDLLERGALALDRCHFVVLDEADRMLDMGFEPQLKQVVAAVPDKSARQTLFFTATWPKAVRRVASTLLRPGETTEVFVGEAGAACDGELAANRAVTQTFIEAQDDEKDKRLYEFLCSLDDGASVVIFANTKRRVDFVARTFWGEGFTTCAVHGDKQQSERDTALRKFVSGECAILVATDVAARGLDIKGVTHVINFDMARDVESYVHRIGRTGRAGELGAAVTFWNKDYDIACSPALVKIARNAGQVVPEFLRKYETSKASKQWKVADAEKAAALLTSGSVSAP